MSAAGEPSKEDVKREACEAGIAWLNGELGTRYRLSRGEDPPDFWAEDASADLPRIAVEHTRPVYPGQAAPTRGEDIVQQAAAERVWSEFTLELPPDHPARRAVVLSDRIRPEGGLRRKEMEQLAAVLQATHRDWASSSFGNRYELQLERRAAGVLGTSVSLWARRSEPLGVGEGQRTAELLEALRHLLGHSAAPSEEPSGASGPCGWLFFAPASGPLPTCDHLVDAIRRKVEKCAGLGPDTRKLLALDLDLRSGSLDHPLLLAIAREGVGQAGPWPFCRVLAVDRWGVQPGGPPKVHQLWPVAGAQQTLDIPARN